MGLFEAQNDVGNDAIEIKNTALRFGASLYNAATQSCTIAEVDTDNKTESKARAMASHERWLRS